MPDDKNVQPKKNKTPATESDDDKLRRIKRGKTSSPEPEPEPEPKSEIEISPPTDSQIIPSTPFILSSLSASPPIPSPFSADPLHPKEKDKSAENKEDKKDQFINDKVSSAALQPILPSFSKPNIFEKVDHQIKLDIEKGFPGAVLLIFKNGETLKETAYGYRLRYNEEGHELAHPEEMTIDTQFDLASNTKMYGPNFAVMHLVYQKKLDVDRPVKYYLSEYTGDGRDERLVRDLLTHTAGYKPIVQFYDQKSLEADYGSDLGPVLYSQSRESTIRNLLTRLPFVRPRGGEPQYSDADFMILGILIERITGKRLDIYLDEEIYKPLGLKNTGFNPQRKDVCAATELAGNTRSFTRNYPGIRTNVIQGEVHDENARGPMEGVSGHAGLFSTARELHKLMQVPLNNGRCGDVVLWDEKIQKQFTQPYPLNDSFALGWRLAGDKQRFELFGQYAPADAYGHSGFTGIFTKIYPKYKLGFVLLTNKIHTPFKDGQFLGSTKEYVTGLYKGIFDLIDEALELTPKSAPRQLDKEEQSALSLSK